MKPEKEIVIHIGNKEYKVTEETMTGVQLRQLGAVEDNRDLFLTVPGNGDDKKIANDESVLLENGMHFYSAPTTINPGK